MLDRRVCLLGVALSVVALSVVGIAPAARAVDLTLTIKPGPGAEFAKQAGLDVGQLQLILEQQLQEYFQLYRLDDFLRELGDGQSFTNRGLGVDYASDWNAVILGMGANVAFNLDSAFKSKVTGQLFEYGPGVNLNGVNLTVMAGLNLEALGLGPFKVYTNYFVFTHAIGRFDTRSTNFGLHVQMSLFKPHTTGIVGRLFRWGGLEITTGVEQEKGVLWLQSTGLTTSVPLDQVSPATKGATVKVDAKGDISFYTRAVTMPIELTTNLRLLHLLSFYGGVGYDLKVASAVDGYMTATTTLTGRAPALGTQELDIGTAQVQVAHLSRLSEGDLRFLAGVQLNLFLVKLFVHGNVLMHDPLLYTIGTGFRLAY
jgi:hypothetical protein